MDMNESFSLQGQHPFCGGTDQIGEAFSDWMGTEILADYMEKNMSSLSQKKKMNGISNLSSRFCYEGSGFDVHPDSKLRIDRLLMANPKIRDQIGCSTPKNNVHYCKIGEDFKGTRQVYQREDLNPEPTDILNKFKNNEGISK
jgi:hypothetical protein